MKSAFKWIFLLLLTAILIPDVAGASDIVDERAHNTNTEVKLGHHGVEGVAPSRPKSYRRNRSLKTKTTKEVIVVTKSKAAKAPKAPKEPKSPKAAKAPKGSKAKQAKSSKKGTAAVPSPEAITFTPVPSPAAITFTPSHSHSFLSEAPSEQLSLIPSLALSTDPTNVESEEPSSVPSRELLDGSIPDVAERDETVRIGKIVETSDGNESNQDNGAAFVLFSKVADGVGHESRSLEAREKSRRGKYGIPRFICDNGGDLLCDATELSRDRTLWMAGDLESIRSTSKYTAYQLHIYNVGTGRFFTPYYGDDKVKMVDDPAKADLWTFEYGEDGVVIIHPGNSYDEALCMTKDGNGFYYKRGLGDELPTQDLLRLEENCQFPMFGRGVSFPL